MRKVNTDKKSNIKCEHCKNYEGQEIGRCKLIDEKKYYYQRCQSFDWNKRIKNQDTFCVTDEVKE